MMPRESIAFNTLLLYYRNIIEMTNGTLTKYERRFWTSNHQLWEFYRLKWVKAKRTISSGSHIINLWLSGYDLYFSLFHCTLGFAATVTIKIHSLEGLLSALPCVRWQSSVSFLKEFLTHLPDGCSIARMCFLCKVASWYWHKSHC